MANTKIVATLGPATDSPESIKQLVEAGADVFRLNMSHGNAEEHAARIRMVREASAGLRRNAAILADLQGPKIRLGTFENGGCTLATAALHLPALPAILRSQDRAEFAHGPTEIAESIPTVTAAVVAAGNGGNCPLPSCALHLLP